jgi:hypothetical protein
MFILIAVLEIKLGVIQASFHRVSFTEMLRLCCLLVRGVTLCVQPDVFVEIARVSEGTEAELAFQWLVARVCPVKDDSKVSLRKGEKRSSGKN